MTIQISKLKKSFNGSLVLNNINLKIKKGKITAFIGPNGCGKSTFLNILAGITERDNGSILIPGLDKFKFSYILQNYRETLMPWKNNESNLGFPLKIQNLNKDIIEKRIAEVKNFSGTGINFNLYPYELSGGQQQILAFLRALITRPSIMLLDEPFSALDYDNTLRMRDKLQEYYLKEKPTILIITHDIEEAVYLADEIVVFSNKPTRIIKCIKNNLPYPRTINTLARKEFHKIKSKVLELFRQAMNYEN